MTDGRVHFVVGMSRCGITPLCRCLNLHPDVAVFGESRFFGRYYVEPATASGYDEAQLAGMAHVLRQFRWTATVGDEPGCLRNLSLDSLHDLITETVAAAEAPIAPGTLFVRLAERVAEAEDKRYAFEKTPHHLRWIERIVRHIPDARFVVLLCNPYDFARFHRQLDASYHPLAVALLWRGYVRAYERAARRYPARLVVVDTADLARDAAPELVRVQRFFGLELHDLAAPLEPVVRFLAASDELDSSEVFWVNLVCGRLMRRHGYGRLPTPVAPRPIVESLVSLPRWCVDAIPRLKTPGIGPARYLLHWMRP